nr:MAG TPA: hypothetical protein [Caudoviricetes sp.]
MCTRFLRYGRRFLLVYAVVDFRLTSCFSVI